MTSTETDVSLAGNSTVAVCVLSSYLVLLSDRDYIARYHTHHSSTWPTRTAAQQIWCCLLGLERSPQITFTIGRYDRMCIDSSIFVLPHPFLQRLLTHLTILLLLESSSSAIREAVLCPKFGRVAPLSALQWLSIEKRIRWYSPLLNTLLRPESLYTCSHLSPFTRLFLSIER